MYLSPIVGGAFGVENDEPINLEMTKQSDPMGTKNSSVAVANASTHDSIEITGTPEALDGRLKSVDVAGLRASAPEDSIAREVFSSDRSAEQDLSSRMPFSQKNST